MSGCSGIASGIPSSVITSPDNFSYNEITKTITVPDYQQMIVAEEIIVVSGGELRLEGELVLIV